MLSMATFEFSDPVVMLVEMKTYNFPEHFGALLTSSLFWGTSDCRHQFFFQRQGDITVRHLASGLISPFAATTKSARNRLAVGHRISLQ